jgi:hypothetical protein
VSPRRTAPAMIPVIVILVALVLLIVSDGGGEAGKE